MKKIIRTLLSVAVVGCMCMTAFGCSDNKNTSPVNGIGNTFTLSSPDGSIVTTVDVDDLGACTYSVSKNGTAMIEKSNLGFDIAEDDFSVMTLESEKTRRVSGEYDTITGKNSSVKFECNELMLTLKGCNFYLDIVMRNYDDGYAFRYNVRAVDGSSGVMTVKEERSEFALPNSYVWSMPYISESIDLNQFSYESSYTRRSATGLAELHLSMPLIYKLRSDDMYSLITESELIGSGYYGSFLQEQEAKRGSGILQTVHTPGSYDPDSDNKIKYPFQSPWRVGITGDLKTVQESDLVEKLYDDAEYWKPDNYDELSDEEKEIYTYDWVEPGISSWSWLSYENEGITQKDYSLHYEYVALAADMGWPYYLLDAGWDDNLDPKVWNDFISYAHNNNVKIMVWAGSLLNTGNGNKEVIAEKFKKWHEMGIDGLKIDFFDGQGSLNADFYGEDVGTINLYEVIYREAAKNKLLVNCHGCNKPTGERRKYPNVINREAIQGNEFRSVDSSIIVNELFVRNVVGPCDFTPVVNPLSGGLTIAQQMALAVLFESGAPSMADKADIYYEEPFIDYYASIPAAREKTLFLCGELDRYYVAAVKAGDYWFVAGACATNDRTASIDFTFLDDGNYEATIYEDDIETDSIKTSTQTITKSDKKELSMTANGGFVIRLKKS